MKKDGMGGACGTYDREESTYTWLWLGGLKEWHQPEYIILDGRIILKWVAKKQDAMAKTGLILLRTATSDGHISLPLSIRKYANINFMWRKFRHCLHLTREPPWKTNRRDEISCAALWKGAKESADKLSILPALKHCGWWYLGLPI